MKGHKTWSFFIYPLYVYHDGTSVATFQTPHVYSRSPVFNSLNLDIILHKKAALLKILPHSVLLCTTYIVLGNVPLQLANLPQRSYTFQ